MVAIGCFGAARFAAGDEPAAVLVAAAAGVSRVSRTGASGSSAASDGAAVPATPRTRSASVVSSKRPHDRHPHARPQQLRRAHVGRARGVIAGLARAHDAAVGSLGDALDRGDRALQRLDDLGHRDLVGRAREHVAAARAAPAVDEPGLAQPCHQMLEVGQRQAVALGDLRERHDGLLAVGALCRPLRQGDHHAHAVLGLG